MYTDPLVVRRKVEREIGWYNERIDHYRARGIWLLGYTFPELLVAFVAPRTRPHPMVPMGIVLNLSNYDVEPPSVTLVNPLTRAPLKFGEVPNSLVRLRALQALGPPGTELPQVQYLPATPGKEQIPGVPGVLPERLVQGWSEEDPKPFICLQGVREYHDNPGHSGDPWWLHRSQGAGRFLRVLEVIAKYGSEAMTEQLQVQQQFRVQVLSQIAVDVQ